ncbi:hypothetical protein [Planctomycetes bacterium K23_9]|uniref:Uncharacterized protein n=1 Tax=Stieleria marina TaxID=1930275 RepID=A0A517NRD2_9BACT|nr:hypothetical protein K239x_16320 [Planctomycetes bacterium K23_9]
MAKSKGLKQKLKAADRRRRQRLAESSAGKSPSDVGTQTPAAARVDVVDLVTAEILRLADITRDAGQDVVVLAALRGCLVGKTPSGHASEKLFQVITQVADRVEVSTHAFRAAVKQLIETQKKHQDPNDPGAFVEYLRFMTA